LSPALVLSEETISTAAILLLSVVAIETGGYYMLALVRGGVAATPFQLSFARAGHAHAGVLVILSLIVQLYADAAGATGPLAVVARDGVPLAAILIPAGFFFSSMGRGRTRPNAFIWLVYGGSASLAAGVIALALTLLAS
jgi:hypothetical protein